MLSGIPASQLFPFLMHQFQNTSGSLAVGMSSFMQNSNSGRRRTNFDRKSWRRPVPYSFVNDNVAIFESQKRRRILVFRGTTGPTIVHQHIHDCRTEDWYLQKAVQPAPRRRAGPSLPLVLNGDVLVSSPSKLIAVLAKSIAVLAR